MISSPPRAIAIIPARYGSTRLPGKPLAPLGDAPLVVHTWRKAREATGWAVVATDSGEIAQAVRAHGGQALLTAKAHDSGTSRCAEALGVILARCEEENTPPPEVVLNVQGDEPFISPTSLRALINAFSERETEIATLTRRLRPEEDPAYPHWVKIARAEDGHALYFSRAAIPFHREPEATPRPSYWKHIGVYAFRTAVLQAIANLPTSPLAQAESLEQLTWLERGYRIQTVPVREESLSIDTPEDLAQARALLKNEKDSQ